MADKPRHSAGTPPWQPTPSVLLAMLSLLCLAACVGQDGVRDTVTLGGPTMGTTWSVKVADASGELDSVARAQIDTGIRDLLTRISTLVSTWDPESELSRFNRSTSLEPFPVAPETFELFKWAVALSDQTGGAFDVTVAPLVDAWGFGAEAPPAEPPDEEMLSRLREALGVRHLDLDPAGRWVRKRRADIRCDFSAFAPGYAADRIAALLAQHGLADFLVDVGGELVARGHNDMGSPWRIAIEHPLARGRAVARLIPLTDAAIATSGDYRNYLERGGERFAHILDPVTGRPVRHRLASVSVIDELGVRADALATALMVLGPDEGMALVERLDLPAMFIVRAPAGTRFEQRVSPRFAAMTGLDISRGSLRED